VAPRKATSRSAVVRQSKPESTGAPTFVAQPLLAAKFVTSTF
jgi:hypothetical protein